MLLFENISMAVSGLLANKMRALLTMLGIIIGIGSVIGIMTVGDSLQSSVTESMQSMGANNITVSVTTKDEDDETAGGLTRLFMPSDPSDEDLLTDEMIDDYRTAFGDEVYAVSLTESVGSYTAESGGESAPVSVTGIVWGKFLSAFSIYLFTMLITLIPAFVIGLFSDPSWASVFGNFLASLLYGAAIIAIGVFISSLTESQIVALVGTVGTSILLMLIDSLGAVFGNEIIETVVSWISFQARYTPFTNGIFNVSSVVFFLSVVAVFNFITARRLESRRWS